MFALRLEMSVHAFSAKRYQYRLFFFFFLSLESRPSELYEFRTKPAPICDLRTIYRARYNIVNWDGSETKIVRNIREIKHVRIVCALFLEHIICVCVSIPTQHIYIFIYTQQNYLKKKTVQYSRAKSPRGLQLAHEEHVGIQ